MFKFIKRYLYKSIEICYNNILEESLCKTNCNHIYCKDCLHTWFDRGNIECPMCRVNVRSYENNGIQNHLYIKIYNQIARNCEKWSLQNQNSGIFFSFFQYIFCLFCATMKFTEPDKF